MIKVLPSSNPEKEENLVVYARNLIEMGVEYMHCDVMDGVFVENTCLPFSRLVELRNNTNILLDIHLMIENPIKKIKEYIALKPNIITIHYETCKNVCQIKRLSKMVRSKDILFGIAIKPNTPVSALFDLIDYVDVILIMSVEPGKSGQKFMDTALQKIKDASILVGDRNIIIEVDGGINEDNCKQIINAGARFLVMGKAFFKSQEKDKLLHKVDKHYKISIKI